LSSRKASQLDFRPIDLEHHRDIVLQFRADSFVVSFGNADRFYEDDGKGDERYVTWLQEKIASDPNSVVHVFDGDKIVGQIEMARFRNDANVGYVNLYYLTPDRRGDGLGAQLDSHATNYFRSLGLSRARLSVSPTNVRAVRFYEKMGWINLGPREGHPEVNYMEKILG
jgi:RimJ/RimL family protein N-acetyltransferase